MEAENEHHGDEQKIAYARATLWMPFYAVGMAVRVWGDVPEELARAALRKLQALYPPLASRICMKGDGSAWLTREGVDAFQLEVRPRVADDDWTRVFLEQERFPFTFDQGPLTRFFLLRGGGVSELLAVAPHVVCDGYSMTRVMWDAAVLLNDPGREVTCPLPAPQVTWETVRHAPLDDGVLRAMVMAINRTWAGPRMALDQARYEELSQYYWARQQSAMLAFTLGSAETSALVNSCRRAGVSVTSGLMTAFLLAQAEVRPELWARPCRLAVAVSVRDRMLESPGTAVGIYASGLYLTLRPRRTNGAVTRAAFWDLARKGHADLCRALNDRARVLRPLLLDALDPRISDAMVAAMVTGEWQPGFAAWMLNAFVRMRHETQCMSVSNIGRVDLPEVGTAYPLATLLPCPPLGPANRMALNVLTVNGQMTIVLKFRRAQMDESTVTWMKDRALQLIGDTTPGLAAQSPVQRPTVEVGTAERTAVLGN